MKNSYDAVIIGAGHNSLVCAAHLQAKGWSTGIFEQNAVPGGAVKTLELTEPGYRHDWAAMNLSLFAGSSFFAANGEALAKHGLSFSPAEHCFASVFPDGKWLGVSTDVSVTAERIAEFSRQDAETWRSMVGSFPGKAEVIFALLGSPMKKRAVARQFMKTAFRKGIPWTADLVRLLISSPRTWLEETFQSEHLRATLAAWGMHLDFAPDIAGGAVFPYLESMANQSFGMVIGTGGAGAMTDALVGLVRERGGDIHCDCRVERVVHEGGRASGIVLADGQRIDAAKAVIANVAPGVLVRDLLEDGSGDAGFDKRMTSFSHAPGTMMLHLAMDDLPDWSAGGELKKFAYVHVAPSLAQMARTYAQATNGLLPDEPVLVVGQPTVVDPSRAPKGKHVLWVQVRMVPGEITGDAAGKIQATDWDEVKDAYADRVIGILEKYAPGVASRIRKRTVVSPRDLETDNPNLVGGDQICGSHHLSQHFFFRPAMDYATGRTPVRGLYLTGAGVWPGAGTGAGPGTLLGRELAGS